MLSQFLSPLGMLLLLERMDYLTTSIITRLQLLSFTRLGLDWNLKITAQKIAALACQRAQDRNWPTPFSMAAQEAGFCYYGGKLDDITVVVSYITSSAGV